MIKNRTVQLMYQTAFCTLGLVAIVASLGTFNYEFSPQFYVHFTNLSNYLCIGIVFVELIETVKKKKDSYVTKLPVLKFVGLLAIMLTFFIFNFLLAGTRDMYLNFRINSVLLHIVLPIMYLGDWILFYEHNKLKWTYPLLSTLFPIAYAIFIFIRAWIVGFNPEVPFLYPYFFLDLDTLGVLGVLKWILILACVFIVVGYLVFGLDKLLASKYKKEIKKK